MTNPSNSAVQNLLPVQAYFNLDGSFNTFIGQGTPFYATVNPSQSGLNITNSTINSTTIGATTPSTGVFTNIATTTGTITTAASGPTDIVNKQYVDYFAAGLSWKAPALTATSANITLSGLQTINGVTVVAGDIVLVKDQGTASENGIYVASAGPWTYSVGGDTWSEYIGAIIFIASGTLGGTAWYCTAQPGGTLGVTAMNWSNFSVSSTYTAGTGLTLTGTVFSITNTGVSAATYGSATASAVIAVNAQGQITSASSSTITPAVGSITGLGTGVATALAAGVTGSGNIVLATSPSLVTPLLGTVTSGDFSTGTFTWPTFNQSTTGTAAKATNLVGGAAGSVPYQSATDTTTFLAAGSNGQVLTLASGVPSWATPTTGTVTSIATAGTVSGITLTGGPITTTGTITLGGTLDLSAPPTIGNTTPNTGRFTTLTVDDNTTLGSSNTDTVTFNARINSDFDPATDNAYDLGRTGHEWRNLFITGTANIDSLVADTADINAGTIDNTTIGGTTPLAGTFTTLRVNSTISLNGSTGTANYLLQSNGASAPTWVDPASLTVSTATTATNAINTAITDDTTTNATMYPTWVTTTTGNLPQKTSSTKLSFNPSTGVLAATGFSGSGASLTALSASNISAGTLAIAYGGTNGSATPTAGAVPYGTGSAYAFTAAGTSGQVLQSNGSSAPSWVNVSSGAVVQVKTASTSTRQSFSSGTATDLTGLTVNITPTSASNKILVIVNCWYNGETPTANYYVKLQRNGTNIGQSGGNDTAGYVGNAGHRVLNDGQDQYSIQNGNFSFVDSPATTSTLTYKCQGQGNSASFYFNQSPVGSYFYMESSITVMEVTP